MKLRGSIIQTTGYGIKKGNQNMKWPLINSTPNGMIISAIPFDN
ncbi:MAG: hypothetical protein ACK5TU_19100 [Cyclobacteriaceae bacterium]